MEGGGAATKRLGLGEHQPVCSISFAHSHEEGQVVYVC